MAGTHTALTTQDIEFRLNSAWGGLVALKEPYKGAKYKHLFEDRDYGEFTGFARHVFSGRCGHIIRLKERVKAKRLHAPSKAGKKKLPIEAVAARVKAVWGDTVTLCGPYNGSQKRSLWHDKEYGEFWARATHVFKNHGHPTRGKVRAIENHVFPENNYELPPGVTLKPGQPEVRQKQWDKRIFVDAVYGEFESTFFGLQQLGHSLHPKATEIRLNAPTFKAARREASLAMWKRITANGQPHPNRSEKANAKRKATNLVKYGTEYPLNSKLVRARVSETRDATIAASGKTKKEYYRDNMRSSMRRIYGVDNISQISDFRLKAARSARNIYDVQHWETKEWIPCYGTWEVEVAQYFNRNRIKFEKETFTYKFDLAGKLTTYTPDFYLPESNVFVEVKGRLYDTFRPKWEAFKRDYPTAELWDLVVLKGKGIL